MRIFVIVNSEAMKGYLMSEKHQTLNIYQYSTRGFSYIKP